MSRCFLADLAEHHYPTVISTRSDLVAGDPYLELLQQNGNVIVQFSFVSTVTKVAARFEPRSSSPADLLRAAVRLRDAGINVTARWQPYIPGVSEKPAAFIRHVTDAGIQHVALEHLKVPFEQNHPLWSEFTSHAGSKLLGWLKDNAMNQHDGREYVLPARLKIDTVLEAREAARRSASRLEPPITSCNTYRTRLAAAAEWSSSPDFLPGSSTRSDMRSGNAGGSESYTERLPANGSLMVPWTAG